jgi:ABC-type nitrate/sulfonate/bicarbonate transport system substrate-binding protein
MKYLIKSTAILTTAISLLLSLWDGKGNGAEYPIPGPRDQVAISYGAVSASYGALWIAKETGILDRNGLEARLIFIQSSPTNVQALINNNIQISVSGSVGVINSAAGGLDLIFIGAMYESLLYHLVADSSIKTVKDLKGKKIGVSRFGSSSHYAVEAVLQKMGLDPKKDVTVLQIGTENVRAAAIAKGGIQATVITPPLNPALKRLGLHTLLSLKTAGIPYITDAMSVRRNYYNGNPRPVKRFLRSMVEAFAFYKKPENKPFVMHVLAKYQGLDLEKDRELLIKTVDVFANEFYGRVPYVPREGLAAVIKTLGERNPEVQKLNLEKLVDDSYLQELEKGGFVESLYK